MHTTSRHLYIHWPYLLTIPHSSFASKSGANLFYTPSPSEFVYDLYQRHYQFSQIICREVYGQFNPCRSLGKTLFSVNFHPLLHSSPLSLSAPLQCGVSFCLFFYIPAYLPPHPRPRPKTLRQHAAYANHWPFILSSRPQPWMRPQENTHSLNSHLFSSPHSTVMRTEPFMTFYVDYSRPIILKSSWYLRNWAKA